MKLVKDKLGKVICGADARSKSVEILSRETRTLIQFKRDGTLDVQRLARPKTVT